MAAVEAKWLTQFITARNAARTEDNTNIAIVKENLNGLKKYIELISNDGNIIDRVKCSMLINSIENVIGTMMTQGLSAREVKTFFGFEYSENSDSFTEILKKSDEEIEKKIAPWHEKSINRLPVIPPADYPVPGISGVDVTSPEDNDSDKYIRKKGDIGNMVETPIMPFQGNRLSPGNLTEFIGQKHIVTRIKAELSAAKKLGNKYIDNILLFGNRGLGKTTLMQLIANELGVECYIFDASASKGEAAIHRFLINIGRSEKPAVIGIDELHALSAAEQTALLGLLSSRVYSYLDKNGVTHRIPIEEFTFIGATTDSDKILPTLKDRCTNLTFYLKDYSPEELRLIFISKFTACGLKVSEEVVAMCVDRCRSSIREAEAFIKGMLTQAVNDGTDTITQDMAKEYFAGREIGEMGITAKDKEIISTLYNEPSGIMSAETLAARVHMDTKVLIGEFEPYLIKIGFVTISSRGRSLTEKARDYYKSIIKND